MKIKNLLLGICVLLFVSGCGSKLHENEASNGIDKEESQVSTDSTSLSNNGIESYLSEANQYYENGDFFNAIETYKKASALEKNAGRCKEGLCNSYLKWSDSKLSEQDIVASLCLLDQGIGEVGDENYKNSLRSRKKYIIDNTYLAETYSDYDGYYWSREEYDSNGNRIRFEDSSGLIIEESYDSNGNVVLYSYSDSESMISYSENYEYDESGRLLSSTDSDGGQTIYEYNNEGKLIHKAGGTYTYEEVYYVYDGNWEYENRYDSGIESWSKTLYDDVGRQLYYENSYGDWRNKTYNENGLLQHEEASVAGRTIAYDYEYNANGDIVRIVDSDNNRQNYEYDERGNLIEYSTSKGYWEKNKYDENGNLVYSENSKGSIHSWKYDYFMNKISENGENQYSNHSVYENKYIFNGETSDGISIACVSVTSDDFDELVVADNMHEDEIIDAAGIYSCREDLNSLYYAVNFQTVQEAGKEIQQDLDNEITIYYSNGKPYQKYNTFQGVTDCYIYDDNWNLLMKFSFDEWTYMNPLTMNVDISKVSGRTDYRPDGKIEGYSSQYVNKKYIYDENGNLTYSSINEYGNEFETWYTYDNENHVIKKEEREVRRFDNGDRIDSKTTEYIYQNGMLIKEIKHNDDNDYSTEKVYEYNDGLLINDSDNDADGISRGKNVYTYYPSGFMESCSYYNYKGKLDSISYYYESGLLSSYQSFVHTDFFDYETNEYKMYCDKLENYEYDMNNRLIYHKRTSFDVSGNIEYWAVEEIIDVPGSVMKECQDMEDSSEAHEKLINYLRQRSKIN